MVSAYTGYNLFASILLIVGVVMLITLVPVLILIGMGLIIIAMIFHSTISRLEQKERWDQIFKTLDRIDEKLKIKKIKQESEESEK